MRRFIKTVLLLFALALFAVTAVAGAIISPDNMMETIRFLSSAALQGRGLGTAELDKAALSLAQQFEAAGLQPGADNGGWFQEWVDPELKIRMRNVMGVLPGVKQEMTGQSVVVGAHYDHLGLGIDLGQKEDRGKVHPGADDNASGVAVLIEIARAMAIEFEPDRNVVFVAFTGEEAGKRGSKYYVAHEKRFPVGKCVGMVNIDTVGRLEKKKDLIVLGAGSAKEWPLLFRGAGTVAGVGIADVAEDLDSSDQKSFQDAGVPAVQLFSGAHLDYHRPADTIERISAEGLVKVASVAKIVIQQLAQKPEPLTVTLHPEAKTEAAPRKDRKAGIGAVPDYGFRGLGVRLSGVAPGSPAEAAGLREGDVIVKVNAAVVQSLRDYSEIIRTLNPGTRITLTVLREGKELKTDAVLRERE